MALMASTIGSRLAPPTVIGEGQSPARTKYSAPDRIGFKPLVKNFQPLATKRSLIYTARKKNDSLICAAASSAQGQAQTSKGQTQTLTRESSTITVAPGKDPKLDDGGSGFPPGDDGDGGGGGGGGGGNYSGGFFFFGFLALLGLFNDQESEGGGSYEVQGRRRRR